MPSNHYLDLARNEAAIKLTICSTTFLPCGGFFLAWHVHSVQNT